MKLIFKIAKAELRNLFYSPVAWFLSIAFLVQCALFYTGVTEPATKMQDVLVKNSPDFKGFGVSLTEGIFTSSSSGVFNSVLQNLFLFIPLLTMSLISREINSGTFRLLYSSPVKTRQIVVGKFLAIILYNMVLMGIVGFFVLSAVFNIDHAELSLLLSGMLGFFLLIGCYTAIGMFMSSLSTYQIVSALATFLLIFVLSRIGGLWQQYDFVRDLTYFLSISGRTENMLKGLITTKDVLYFLVVIYMFVGFTIFRLRGSREFKPWYIKASRYVAVVLSGLLIGYVSSRPAVIGYWDTTRDKRNTLHPNTQKVVADLGKDELEVTLFTNLLGRGASNGFPQARNKYLSTMWEPYVRFKPDITFKYEYYYDVLKEDSGYYKSFPNKTLKEIAELMAEGMQVDLSKYKTPEEMRKIVDLEPEGHRVVMQLKYKGKTCFLRTYDDSRFWPDEMHVAAAFKRLTEAEIPKVLYTSGNYERNIYKEGEREFNLHSIAKSARSALINVGFDLDSINLDTQDIPANTSTLVVADPKSTFSEVKLQKLRNYIDRGGNMMILGEPGKQEMLNPLLSSLKLQLADGTLVQLSNNEMPHMVTPYTTLANAALADETNLIILRKSNGKDTVKNITPGATEVLMKDSSDFTIQTMLTTIPGRVYRKIGKLVVDSAAPIFNAAEGDLKKESFPVYIALSRKINNREQRIIVGGDADFMSTGRGGGGAVSRSYFSWMDYNRFPIYTHRPVPTDVYFKLSVTGAKTQRIVYVWILPALMLAIGIIVLIRRKRK